MATYKTRDCQLKLNARLSKSNVAGGVRGAKVPKSENGRTVPHLNLNSVAIKREFVLKQVPDGHLKIACLNLVHEPDVETHRLSLPTGA